MQSIYDFSIIPLILKTFKVNYAVVSGLNDKNLINTISNDDIKFTQINTNDGNCINGSPLNVLRSLENYDAIFINDDSNWYTVFNQLKIIKKTNEEFPLVFICNNNFPNKRRDSYSNPATVPARYRQKYTKGLNVCYNNKEITISDGFYHACEENTPKNGVLTAIEDFLKENSHIGVMKINFIKEICILYHKTQINQKRISIIAKNIKNNEIENINLSDKLVENQLLISYINKYESYTENFNDFEVEMSRKDTIINDYENKINSQNSEMALKDSKINGFESNLSLKEAQIKNIESKLVNRDRRINDLKGQLEVANDNLNSLALENEGNCVKINNLEGQLEVANDNLNSLTNEINNKDVKINELKIELGQKKSEYNNQINSLNEEINQNKQNLTNTENEFQELIKIKNDQISSLKDEIKQKVADFTIIENNLNNQINNNDEVISQRDNRIKIQKHELDEKNTKIHSLEHYYAKQLSKIHSLEHSYVKHLSKLDNKEYCISCYKEELSNNQLEINYLRNNNLTKKILSPFAYVYLILKSNYNEISLNIKLYQVLKDSGCFDIGFYLNKNKDLINSRWCKYFSPELHYVCKGFNENRTFNKKYFNRSSKKDLLKYVLTYDK